MNYLHHCVTSSRIDPNTVVTLAPNSQIPSTCVFLWGKKPIFCPHKTAGKVFFFCAYFHSLCS